MELMTPLFVILCPAIAAALILASRNQPNIREGWTIAASLATFLLVLSMAPEILKGETIKYILFQPMFKNIYIGFKVDAFGEIFAITTSSLWILVSIYSIGYMRALKEHAQTRYYFAFCLAIFGAIGVALSANLLTMFIFYEIITVSTYPLVIHEQTPEALRAGHKYFAYLITAGAFLLFGIMTLYYFTGTTEFTPGGIKALGSAPQAILIVLFFCFLLGFMKAAWMPFHSWLPTAMIAPTPVSALLHAVAVVKAGVFGIVRLVCYVYGVNLMHELNLWLVLAIIASFTMLVGSFFAIAQDDLKKRLAYSTISQLSYIILGASLLTENGVRGAMLLHTIPRLHEDNSVPLCRRYHGSYREEKDKRDGWDRKNDAHNHARLQHSCDRHGRDPTCSRVHQQVLSLPWRIGSNTSLRDYILSGHPDKLVAGCRLFLPHNTHSILQEACGRYKHEWRREDKGGPSFDGRPSSNNCNLLHHILRISEYVLYIRPCENGRRGGLRRRMKIIFPNFILSE